MDAITALNPGTGLEVSAARERAEVNREQFLEILVTEMVNQNPLDPMDNEAFLQQLVGLQTLEQTSALTDALKTFERFMQMSSASGLIGRTIKGVNDQGDLIEGVVDKVVMEHNDVMLRVGPHSMPFRGVGEIL
jgi:flagellar basal-body rod modification protein FlgD